MTSCLVAARRASVHGGSPLTLRSPAGEWALVRGGLDHFTGKPSYRRPLLVKRWAPRAARRSAGDASCYRLRVRGVGPVGVGTSTRRSRSRSGAAVSSATAARSSSGREMPASRRGAPSCLAVQGPRRDSPSQALPEVRKLEVTGRRVLCQPTHNYNSRSSVRGSASPPTPRPANVAEPLEA